MKYCADAQCPAGINRNSSGDCLPFYLEPPPRQSSTIPVPDIVNK